MHQQRTEGITLDLTGWLSRPKGGFMSPNRTDGKLKTGLSQSELKDLLLRLLKEMRIESVEYLWDYADDIGIRDEQACQFMVSRLEDFFNRKIHDIERKQ